MSDVIPLNDDYAERYILLSLYRSLKEGTVMPARLIEQHPTEAEALCASGMIERVGNGYRITEAGLRRWAHLVSVNPGQRIGKIKQDIRRFFGGQSV